MMSASKLDHPKRSCRAVNNKFSPSENHRLISHVRKWNCLYDKQDPGYSNEDQRARAWKNITSLIGGHPKKAVADCKNQWHNLRNVYQKRLRSVITEPDSAAAQRALLWPFYEELAFLNDAAGYTQPLSDVDSGLPVPSEDHLEEADLQYGRMESPASDEYPPPQETANISSASTIHGLPQYRNSGLEKRRAHIPFSTSQTTAQSCAAVPTASKLELHTSDFMTAAQSGNTSISVAQEQTFLNYVAASIADTSPEHKPKLLQAIKRAILTVQLEVLEQ